MICPACEGSGQQQCEHEPQPPMYERRVFYVDCAECEGTGEVEDQDETQ